MVRSSAKSKFLEAHHRKKLSEKSQSISAKFASKQSKFQLRSEQEQSRNFQEQQSSIARSPSAVSGSSTNFNFSKTVVSNSGRFQRSTPISQTPFAQPSNASDLSSPTGSTIGSATLGLSKLFDSGKYRTSSRLTRRNQKYNLTEESFSSVENGALGTLLGPGRIGNVVSDDSIPPSKKSRAEKFREILSVNKEKRAALQKERSEREKETQALDEELKGLLHLLPRRNKEDEERNTFIKSGTPEVRKLLQDFKKGHTPKQLILKKSGEFSVKSMSHSASDEQANAPTSKLPREANFSLTLEEQESLKKMSLGLLTEPKGEEELDVFTSAGQTLGKTQETSAIDQETHEKNDDSFDALLNRMKSETKWAHAVERTLTQEELEELDMQQKMIMEDRQNVPSLGILEDERVQLTKKEWLMQGGDNVFQMDNDAYDEDNVDIPSSFEGDDDDDEDDHNLGGEKINNEEEEELESPTASGVARQGELDSLISSMESLVLRASARVEGKDCQKEYEEIVIKLYRFAKIHTLQTSRLLVNVLIECERCFLAKGTLEQSLLLLLYTISKVYPTGDYRHHLMTPVYIFLCSTLMQMKLNSVERVHEYLILATILIEALKDGGHKYVAEAIIASLNVLALQLPRQALEPNRYQGLSVPFPIVGRSDSALLTCREDDPFVAENYKLTILSTKPSDTQLVLHAYHLLGLLCEMYKSIPSFPVFISEPVDALNRLLKAEVLDKLPEVVQSAHNHLLEQVVLQTDQVLPNRTPLAMRCFRPRPIRQFEPLLSEQEANTLKKEIREVKKELREDKKRVIRHIKAEAVVYRRAHEREERLQDVQREKKLHQLMGQLQSQQHIMKTVDNIVARAKGKIKKGISGAPDGGKDYEDGEVG